MNGIVNMSYNKAFRHVENLFVRGNKVRTDQNKPLLLPKKEVCFDQYELDYLGGIKFLHVERPCTKICEGKYTNALFIIILLVDYVGRENVGNISQHNLH